MSVAVTPYMDKPRTQDQSIDGPGLNGPDYFSLVIEWEVNPDEVNAGGAPAEDLDDQITGQNVKHWDVVDEASAESFPASDPPAWMGGAHAAPTEKTAAVCEPTVQALPDNEHVIAKKVGKVAAVGLAAAGAIVWFRHHRRAA